MRVRNFSITLTGDWQTIPLELHFIGLQLRNAATNHAVEYRWSDDGVALSLAAGEDYSIISPKPDTEPMINEIQVKGIEDEIMTGERWLYNYQEIVVEE
jgi:hypothetical protein